MISLQSHLQVKEEDRDRNWDELFFKLIAESNLSLMTQDPQQGPDGWPYLIAEVLTDENKNQGTVDSAQKIFQWLADKGIGLVINPRRTPYPDYVFSYGMIWSFRETGYFIKFHEIAPSTELLVDPNTSIQTGTPSEEYLPVYVRNVLKDFFRDQSVFEAKVLMISTDGKQYDLCFSLESLGNPPENEHQGILEAVSWFLPPHYTLAVISEKGLPPFVTL
jgi:hypothetical protein